MGKDARSLPRPLQATHTIYTAAAWRFTVPRTTLTAHAVTVRAVGQ